MCVLVYVLLNPFDATAPEGSYSALWFCNRNPPCYRASMYSAPRLRNLRSSSPAHYGSVKASHTKKIHDFLCRFVQINQSKLFDSCCRTLGLVFQSENFSYNHCTNYVMDSWAYLDTPNPEQKLRLNPGETMTALTILQEQCRVKKKKKCSHRNKLISCLF